MDLQREDKIILSPMVITLMSVICSTCERDLLFGLVNNFHYIK